MGLLPYARRCSSIMRLSSVAVEGFRSLREVEVKLTGMTVEIGPNGSGKSSFLTAVRLLMDPSLKVTDADFTRDGAGARSVDEITVTGVFELLPEEHELFLPLVVDNCLTISRVFADAGKGEYKCARKGVRAFVQIRSQATGHTNDFNALVAIGQYAGLATASNKQEALLRMTEWEAGHPAELENVLDHFDRMEEVRSRCAFVFVGATSDPIAEVQPSKGTLRFLLESLVDLAAVDEKLQAAVQQSTQAVAEIIQAEGASLEQASHNVTNSIANLSPGLQIRVRWIPPADLRSPMPNMDVTVIGTDGLETDLSLQGHGTQRSVLLALFGALAETGGSETVQRHVLFVIEEPEAFQHPLSARHLAQTLFQLTERGYRILTSTHSPYFVQAKWLEGVCLFHRSYDLTDVSTSIHPLSLDGIAQRLENAGAGSGFTEESTRARLMQIVDATKTEGLFARVVVLVEGVEDAALIRAAGSIEDATFDEAGIAIVAADGKTNLPLLLALFAEAAIPTYVVFDLDREVETTEADEKAEQTIIGLLGKDGLELEDTLIEDSFACSRTTLAALIRGEIGTRFEELFAAKRAELGYKAEQGKKSQAVLEAILTQLAAEGLTSASLTSLIEKIRSLAGGQTGRAESDLLTS